MKILFTPDFFFFFFPWGWGREWGGRYYEKSKKTSRRKKNARGAVLL